jgi:hypothetical protein
LGEQSLRRRVQAEVEPYGHSFEQVKGDSRVVRDTFREQCKLRSKSSENCFRPLPLAVLRSKAVKARRRCGFERRVARCDRRGEQKPDELGEAA